jgi:hypothetical protein
MELKSGMTLCSKAHPENWLTVEAIHEDGAIQFSFPGQPEKGTATLDRETWERISKDMEIIRAPLSL